MSTGSGSPVSTCAEISGSTSRRQAKFSMNWLGQLHRVPGDAVDSRDAGIGHAREHVVQPVAEFVKQRRHFVVGQQRRARAPTGAVKLHTSCATGSALPEGRDLGDHALVHPRAAALLGARIWIEIEAGDDLRRRAIQQIVVADAGMPYARPRCARAPLMPYRRWVTANSPDSTLGSGK